MAKLWKGDGEMTEEDAEEFLEGMRGTYVNTMGAKESSTVKLLYLTAPQTAPQAQMLKAMKEARTTVVIHGFRRSMGPDEYDKAHAVRMWAMEPAAAVQEASGWIGYVGMEGERMRRETPTECLVIPPGTKTHVTPGTQGHAHARAHVHVHGRARGHGRVHGHVRARAQMRTRAHARKRANA